MSPALYSEGTFVQQTTVQYREERLGCTRLRLQHGDARTRRDAVPDQRGRGGAHALPPPSARWAQSGLVGRSRQQRHPRHRPSERRAVHLQINQEMCDLLHNGVKVTYRDPHGGMETRTLGVFYFGDPENNHFLAGARTVDQGPVYRRGADVVCFANGIPRLSMELKTSTATFAAPTTRTSPGSESSGQWRTAQRFRSTTTPAARSSAPPPTTATSGSGRARRVRNR